MDQKKCGKRLQVNSTKMKCNTDEVDILDYEQTISMRNEISGVDFVELTWEN